MPFFPHRDTRMTRLETVLEDDEVVADVFTLIFSASGHWYADRAVFHWFAHNDDDPGK